MLAAIAAPILPSPMKASFCCFVEEFIDKRPILLRHRRNDDAPNNPTISWILKVGFARAFAAQRAWQGNCGRLGKLTETFIEQKKPKQLAVNRRPMRLRY